MIENFSGNWDNSGKSYKAERFCVSVDHNIILFVEPNSDGTECKICNNSDTCEKKKQCIYSHDFSLS